MMMNSTRGDNQVNPYFNDAMSQEISYETTGAGADVSAGGVRINMIPREGGNRFSGAFFTAWSDGGWQANNLTQDLQRPGAFGGRQNRQNLRRQLVRRRSDSSRTSCGSSPRPASGVLTHRSPTFSIRPRIAVPGGLSCSARPAIISCEQAIDDQQIRSGMVRLTWQMSPKNKLGVYYDRLYKTRGHDMLGGHRSATAPRSSGVRPCTTRRKSSGPRRSTTRCCSKLAMAATSTSPSRKCRTGSRQAQRQRRRGYAGGGADRPRYSGLRGRRPNNIPTFVPTKNIYLTTAASYVTGSHRRSRSVAVRHGLV